MQEAFWLLIAMAFFLGLRHGFDLDHLATIDSITRIIKPHQNLSKYVGILFSLGHGLVVITISLFVGTGLVSAYIPYWLSGVGDIIALTCLFVFGLLTLWNVMQRSSKSALPSSLNNYLAKKLIQQNISPACIVSVGLLFAFSFDTVSQVILFSLSAKAMAGCFFSGLLGVMFMLGMMTSDGLNGLFVALLIQRSDAKSLLLSRTIGFLIASFSLIIGVINCIKIYNS